MLITIWVWLSLPTRLVASQGSQTWPSGHNRMCRESRPEIRLPFTIGPPHDAIDVFDTVLIGITPSNSEAVS